MPPDNSIPPEEPTETSLGRRELLKALAASGAVAATEWLGNQGSDKEE